MLNPLLLLTQKASDFPKVTQSVSRMRLTGAHLP